MGGRSLKLVFFSNYYTHHQKAISEQFDLRTNHEYAFVSTEDFAQERLDLGWTDEKRKFVVRHDAATSAEMIKNAENIIFGSAPRALLDLCLKQKKRVFFYSERVFGKGYCFLKWPARVIRFWLRYGRHQNLYLLCASAYTAADYAMHLSCLRRTYRWGYFTETMHYDLGALMKEKNRTKILWCGRLIDWKCPNDVLTVAKRLKEAHYDFEIDFIGSGVLESQLKEQIQRDGLTHCVKLLGAMTPQQVRNHMEKAGIYLFTSNFQEGWGAVLNESMNSGCAVVASHAIGSVPFLLNHGENGLVYKSGDIESLYVKVKYLLDHPDEQIRLGTNAYDTIVNLWNADVASERFLKLTEEIKERGCCDLYEEGPCSRAPILWNSWFEETK